MAAIRGVHRLETNQWILLVGAGFGPDSLQASQNSHGWGPSCPGNPRGKFLFHQVGFQKKPFTQSCCKQIDWLNTMDHFTNVSLTSRYVIRGLISHTELIYIYNWKSKIRISIMYICVLFLATAPIYIYNTCIPENKLAFQTCPFWVFETGMKLLWNLIRGFDCAHWGEESQSYKRLFVRNELTFPSPSIVFGGYWDVHSILLAS